MDRKFSCHLDEYHVERNLKDLMNAMHNELLNCFDWFKYADYMENCCKWIIYPRAWKYIEEYVSKTNPLPINMELEFAMSDKKYSDFSGKLFGIDFQVVNLLGSRFDIATTSDVVELVFSKPRVDYGRYSTYNAVPRNSGRYDPKRLLGLRGEQFFIDDFGYSAEIMAMFREDKKMIPGIKDVIFNNPATIVLWADGTKTIVKCQENDIYDEEKGLAMAIVKKLSGNKGNFNNLFKHWVGVEKND